MEPAQASAPMELFCRAKLVCPVTQAARLALVLPLFARPALQASLDTKESAYLSAPVAQSR